jgi:hypothetical protein
MTSSKRWLLLTLFSLAIAIAAIVGITQYVNSGDPRSDERANTITGLVSPLLGVGLILGVVGLVIVIIKFAVKSGIKEATNLTPPSGPPGFPISTSASGALMLPDGPGQYRIQGVHRETKMDISKYIQADSAANARVKAELDDIVVTSITKMQV